MNSARQAYQNLRKYVFGDKLSTRAECINLTKIQMNSINVEKSTPLLICQIMTFVWYSTMYDIFLFVVKLFRGGHIWSQAV